jgi:putative 4-mercaptohistidine N1-methyltranferase
MALAGASGCLAGSFLAGAATSGAISSLAFRRFCSSQAPKIAVRSTTDSGLGGSDVYETDRAVNEYLQFHYAPDKLLVPYGDAVAPVSALGFTRRCVDLAVSKLPHGQNTRALDVGCAVGGMSFELAKYFKEVVGIDFSHAFVDASNKVKESGTCEFTMKVEGSIHETHISHVDDSIDRSRCSFEQGDACALRADLGSFDAVLAANLLCRLPEPTSFLKRCSSLVKPGGVLVLVSPYSWLPEYTKQEKWLGGREASGSSFDGLSSFLKRHEFELAGRRDMPFIMRDHIRKFQWGCSDGTVWRRR